MSMEMMVVLPFERGSLLPIMNLCRQLTSRNSKLGIVIVSNLSSLVPDSLSHNPLVRIAEIPSPEPRDHQNPLAIELEKILSTPKGRPVCAIIHVTMVWTAKIFHKFKVPTIAFLDSSACSAAMDLAIWRTHPLGLEPVEVHFSPGLPEETALTYKERPQVPAGDPLPQHLWAGHPGQGSGFPTTPPALGPSPDSGFPTSQPGLPPSWGRHGRGGPPPPWVEQVEGSIAAMFNTCADLERPFLEDIANRTGKPAWGVGPFLLEQYWKQANVTEDEVSLWLDSKPRGSVLYVSFGSDGGPSTDEYVQLADALEASNRSFIWTIQPGTGERGQPGPSTGPTAEGYFPHGLDSKVGPRGLIIHGWAPQLFILSHPSTGGFLSHCGWNSIVEAIGRGVPFLAWPDEHHHANANLVVAHLKVGHMISDDLSEMIMQEDIVNGIEKLLGDEEMKQRATALARTFRNGFPASASATLDAFTNSIHKKVV
ncbi:hypothetical protein UlMin_001023 [Ulmus minor]